MIDTNRMEVILLLKSFYGIISKLDYQHNEWVHDKLSNEEWMFFSKLDINYMISHIL